MTVAVSEMREDEFCGSQWWRKGAARRVRSGGFKLLSLQLWPSGEELSHQSAPYKRVAVQILPRAEKKK
ncbi:hypothetical protein PIB30_011599 [Stylosanthes scabra]|uniref:Uncharacterized protein n=1 Tax=Stylosanthes scabra TaxID=79078 RepID=A0ABU6V7N9_9FABA|nr:hypothetical protein [Stylosanthes scabra]